MIATLVDGIVDGLVDGLVAGLVLPKRAVCRKHRPLFANQPCQPSTTARAIGQMLIMGWDGTEITPQIRNLIEHHHLGSILLTAKNLKCKLGPFQSSCFPGEPRRRIS